MALPEHIQKLNNEILETVRRREQHNSDILLRKPLYQAFQQQPNESLFRRKLSLRTAYKVIEIIHEVDTDEFDITDEEKELAKFFLVALENQGEQAILHELHTQLYHASGNWEAPSKLNMAANAAFKAGNEIFKGFFYPSDEEEETYRKGLATDENEYPRVAVKDHDLAEVAIMGDTAASAASAYAAADADETMSSALSADKLLEFWEWWHLEAIPQLWEEISIKQE